MLRQHSIQYICGRVGNASRREILDGLAILAVLNGTAGTAHLLRVRDRGGSVGWRIRMWPCEALSKLSIGS